MSTTRRTFLKYSGAAAAAACVTTGLFAVGPRTGDADAACGSSSSALSAFRAAGPRTALVVWYSQAGNTRRIGRVVAHQLRRAGLTVEESDYRQLGARTLLDFDLVAVGSPVFYYNVPKNFRAWLSTRTLIPGTAVAGFTTYGGPGHNPHNTACDLVDILCARGGVSATIDTFGAMSTFAPTWSSGRVDRVLKYRDQPNGRTYAAARAFADRMLGVCRQGHGAPLLRETSGYQLLRPLGTDWMTKQMITAHHLDKKACVCCGHCVEICPGEAIDLDTGTVDKERCLACMGCVNTCPAQAHIMLFMGKPVYGFEEFLRRNKVVIEEPDLG